MYMAVFAYLRVSTPLQTIENQRYEIGKWCSQKGLRVDVWVNESISGTVAWDKRKLGKAIRKMKSGDLLVCTEISRLGRNMLMIMSILNECSAKGIMIHTIKDNFDLSDSINSKIIAFAFALASEIERNLISQRTKEALAAKKMAGIKLGRPRGQSLKVSRMMAEIDNVRAYLAQGESLKSVAQRYGIHRNTLSQYLKNMKDD